MEQHRSSHHQHDDQSSSGSSPVGAMGITRHGTHRRRSSINGAAVAAFSPPVTPQFGGGSSSNSAAAFASITNGPIAVPSLPPASSSSFMGTAPQIRNIFSFGGGGGSANGVNTGISALQSMSANLPQRASLSPGAKRNSIPLPTLPVTPSTPNGTNTNFAYPERKSALWVLLHGQDDGVRNYQNPNNFQNNFRPDQHPMMPQDHLLKPDDLTSLVLSEHIMNDNNDASHGGLRYPMMPQMEPQPGTVDPTFTVPEWPRGDMGMEARNFPNLRTGLPELPNQMLFDGKVAGGILSPSTPFNNLPANFFKMETNPYNTAPLDFNMLNNYPTLDGQAGSGYPMDGFYNPYMYENNPYEPHDSFNYGPQAPFNASLIAQAQKPKNKNNKKQQKASKKSKGKPSWAEDSSGSAGNNNSKRLRRNWTDEEERKFLEALEMYGRDWHKCAAHLQSRDVVSCRSHAQKYFIKLWINGEPLPKKVAEQGAGYTVSGKPLDPDSSFVRYYMSLFDKRRQGVTRNSSSKSSVDESTGLSAS